MFGALCDYLKTMHGREIYIVVCVLNDTESTLPLSFVEPTKVQVKRLWSEEEKTAVHKHLGDFIKERRVPGKEDCVKTIKNEKILGQRSWKVLKNFVRNTIVALNRRSAARQLEY